MPCCGALLKPAPSLSAVFSLRPPLASGGFQNSGPRPGGPENWILAQPGGQRCGPAPTRALREGVSRPVPTSAGGRQSLAILGRISITTRSLPPHSHFLPVSPCPVSLFSKDTGHIGHLTPEQPHRNQLRPNSITAQGPGGGGHTRPVALPVHSRRKTRLFFLEKAKQSWRLHNSRPQVLLQSHSHQNSTGLPQNRHTAQ